MQHSPRGALFLLAAAAVNLLAELAAAKPSPAEIFGEAEAICRADNGTLWGLSLCGPLLLVEPATRTIFASQPDKQNILRREGEIFTGKLPAEINIANTALEWAGLKWTMMMLPLPEDKHRRAALIAHELWHRIQDDLGLPASGAANSHLDTRDGRYWLQLEWRALSAALAAHGEARKRAIIDAALFRARRRHLSEKAAQEERAMEMHEGLAEYTGAKLSGHADVARFVIDGPLNNAPKSETFVRSFAYANGPAYGLLLDATGGEWVRGLEKDADLGQLLFIRVGVVLPADMSGAADERSKSYGDAELAASEDHREKGRRELVASYRSRLIDGQVLTIPLQSMQMQFNPANLVALEPHGTVYPNIRIVDAWGVLNVTSGGALMSSDFRQITVAAPDNGNGWTLELKTGWKLNPAERSGSFVVAADQ